MQVVAVDPSGDGGASGAGVLGQVGQRFGDDKIGVGLDLRTESRRGHLDGDGQTQAFGQLLDACGETASREHARKDALREFAQLDVGSLGVAERLIEERPGRLGITPVARHAGRG